MGYPFTPGSGASAASDLVSGEHVTRFKACFGPTNASTLVDTGTPLPVKEPAPSATVDRGGVTVTGTSGQVCAANAGRRIVVISNGGTEGIWVRFDTSGNAAVHGSDAYVPAKSQAQYLYSGAVQAIRESIGSTSIPVGFVGFP